VEGFKPYARLDSVLPLEAIAGGIAVTDFFEKTLHDPTALFTLLLFVATFALWWATRGLVLGADETARRQLRAYVSLEPKIVSNWTSQDDKHRVMVRVIARNHGQTPASELAGEIVLEARSTPPDPMVANVQMDFNNTIFPQATLDLDFALQSALPQETVSAVERGQMAIYIFGRVSYFDAFGERHSTLINASFGGEDFAHKIRRGNHDGWQWRYGPRHNEPLAKER
jgi:hypothetical protein